MNTNTELPGIETGMDADTLDKLEALAKAATPQNFDSAQIQNQGHIECPTCDGSGEVELTADYCNYDGRAIGVQFYGIGPEHRAAEAFYRAANPQAVQQLIALARTARLDTTASASIDTPTIRAIVTKAREFYLGYLSRHIPGDDIDAVRADVTTDTATRAIAFDLRASLAPVSAQQAAAKAEIQAGASVRDMLRWSQANTDYHGLIAFTQAQFDHFVSMVQAAAKAPAAQAVDAREVLGYVTQATIDTIKDMPVDAASYRTVMVRNIAHKSCQIPVYLTALEAAQADCRACAASPATPTHQEES